MADFWAKRGTFQSKSEYFLHKYGHNLTFINGMCLKFGRNVQNGLENKNMQEKSDKKSIMADFWPKMDIFQSKSKNWLQK